MGMTGPFWAREGPGPGNRAGPVRTGPRACESAITETWHGADTYTACIQKWENVWAFYEVYLEESRECQVSYNQALGKNLSLLRK